MERTRPRRQGDGFRRGTSSGEFMTREIFITTSMATMYRGTSLVPQIPSPWPADPAEAVTGLGDAWLPRV
jgi:hypothetical protein